MGRSRYGRGIQVGREPFFGAVGRDGRPACRPPGTGKLSITPSSWDFGAVDVDLVGAESKTFTVSNTGGSDLPAIDDLEITPASEGSGTMFRTWIALNPLMCRACAFS